MDTCERELYIANAVTRTNLNINTYYNILY